MSSGVSPEIIERYSVAFTRLAEPVCRIERAIAGLKCRALWRSELQISFYALGVLLALDRHRRIEQGRGSDRSVFVRDGDLAGRPLDTRATPRAFMTKPNTSGEHNTIVSYSRSAAVCRKSRMLSAGSRHHRYP